MKRLISCSALAVVVVALAGAFWFSKEDAALTPPLTREPPPPPPVPSSDAFPWAGATTLINARQQALTWTVTRVDGEVLIDGTHPDWQVEHRARPDGTPRSTVKKANGYVTRVSYTDEGARVERADAEGKKSSVTITEKGLWDAETLAARLAGIAWQAGLTVRFKIIDISLADGNVYPMVAEYVGEEAWGRTRCHHVRLSLDDFRRVFAPTFEFRFAVGLGASYLQHDGDGQTFIAR
ncbi:MAG: hypothetical protein Q8L48_00410 [Archangium sp.]|nr:hypothetical protein [Archangium sp.]